jgi:hypothetical protein
MGLGFMRPASWPSTPNGGGELLCFDESGAVFMLPAIGMEPEVAIRIANCFEELTHRFESPR